MPCQQSINAQWPLVNISQGKKVLEKSLENTIIKKPVHNGIVNARTVDQLHLNGFFKKPTSPYLPIRHRYVMKLLSHLWVFPALCSLCQSLWQLFHGWSMGREKPFCPFPSCPPSSRGDGWVTQPQHSMNVCNVGDLPIVRLILTTRLVVNGWMRHHCMAAVK